MYLRDFVLLTMAVTAVSAESPNTTTTTTISQTSTEIAGSTPDDEGSRFRVQSEMALRILLASSATIFACVWIVNPLTIATILRSKILRASNSNIFLINLAVTDLLFISLVLACLLAEYYDYTMLRVVKCPLLAIVYCVLINASVMSCFAIVVDRFLFISKPLLYRSVVTLRRVLISLVFLWLVSIANSLIPFYDGQSYKNLNCDHKEHDPRNKVIFIAIALPSGVFVLVHITSNCLYTKIFLIIKKHRKLVACFTSSKTNYFSRLESCRQKMLEESSNQSNSAIVENKDDVFPESNQTNVTVENQEGVDLVNESASSASVRPVPVPQSQSFPLREDELITIMEEEYTGSCAKKPLAKISSHNDAIKRSMSVETHQSWPSPKISRRLHSRQMSSESSYEYNSKNVSKRGRMKLYLRDLRTIKTLFLMANVHFICWAPLIVIRILWEGFIIQTQIEQKYILGATMLGTANSIINFIIYPLRKGELRKAFKTMLSPLKDTFVSLCVRLNPITWIWRCSDSP